MRVTRVEQLSGIGSWKEPGELKDDNVNNSVGYTERQTFLPKVLG